MARETGSYQLSGSAFVPQSRFLNEALEGPRGGTERGRVTTFKSKDIFRASQLSLLGVSNYHVERDLKKLRSGKPLSPILLVRVPDLAKVIIADGYHRLCAVYALDEDAIIPCKIV